MATAQPIEQVSDLRLFYLADGTETGVGTDAEFADLVAEGVLPADAYSAPLTAEQARELLA